MSQLANTQHLNDPETQQASQSALTIDWGRVRGGFNPMGGDPPAPLPPDSKQLMAQLQGVLDRMRQMFGYRADYANDCAAVQKDEEPVDEYRVWFKEEFKQWNC